MNGLSFFYYATRSKRHRELAARAKTDWAARSHARLAKDYGERAAAAMGYEFWLGEEAATIATK